MKNRKWLVSVALMVAIILAMAVPMAGAESALRFSCSAQVHEALAEEGLAAFSQKQSIRVDQFIGTSDAAVNRLMNGYSDLAGTVEPLGPRHADYGYKEIPFCRAPLVVITHPSNPVQNLTENQLRDIFSGTIRSWKEVGGPDEAIVVVVPSRNTGAFNNFSYLALRRSEVQYDFMAYRSTRVVMVVKDIPWTISFITMGSYVKNADVKTLSINDVPPTEAAYPYQQTFSFVTKGEPCCEALQFIDFTFSEEGRRIMVKNGMVPLDRK